MPAIRSPARPALPCSARSTGSSLIDNAAAMGDVLKDGLEGLAKRFPFIADVRGKGLLHGAEFVADPETHGAAAEQGKNATSGCSTSPMSAG